VATVGPFYITVDVTRRCNLKCLGCPSHSPHATRPRPGDPSVQDISPDLFQSVCGQLKAMNTGELIFSGEGEPLLHPQLPDLIASAKEAGFRVTLMTNGTLLNESNVHSLIEARPDVVRVSLWASSPDEYRENYPGCRPEFFQQMVDGVSRLCAARAEVKSAVPHISVHQPISRHNCRGIEAFIELARKAACDGVSFSPLKPMGDGMDSLSLSPDLETQVRLSLDRARTRLQSVDLCHNIDQTLRRYELGRDVWRATPCYMGWIHARIRVDGTVLPCDPCGNVLGNLRENSLGEIWNGPAYRSFRRTCLSRQGGA